uniref:Uncharacterized protein n=1 Tax=Glossina morsitans morsitans TaxID=37546 RepID=A0ABK9N764_GLOMM
MPPKRKKAGAEDGASSTSKTAKGSSSTLKPNQPVLYIEHCRS